MNIKIDQNCNLKELFEKVSQQNSLTGHKCPLDSYLLISLRNISISYMFSCIYMLVVINMFQFSNRKLVQHIYNLLIMIYIAKEYVYQNLALQKLINEYTIILFLSVHVLWYISRHNLGILIYRFSQVIFYIVAFVGMSIMISQIRDNNNFFLSMFFQYITYVMKKIGQIYIH